MLACETDNQVESGRWLSPDPLGGDITNPQSLNRYAYALNNPTTFTDPMGLDACTPGAQCVTVYGGTPPDIQILPCSFLAIAEAACYGGSSPAPPGWSMWSPGGNSGDGGGSAPAPKPAPPPSWSTVFAKSFVTNFPQTTWNSLTSSNGCLNQFFSNTLSNLNPFTPSASSIAEPAANFISAVKFNSVLAYAASRPNYLGGTGLLYPFKSRVFSTALKTGQDVLEAVPAIQLDLALGQALYTEATTAKAGGCQ